MRTIVIGDIHGCSKALLGLMDALCPQAEDHFIFLGDYVDRGPDSRGVIEQLLSLRQRCRTTFLLGNHEIMFRGVLAGLPIEPWLLSGGQQTLTSYNGDLKHVSHDHIEFLHACVPYFETDQHLYVHANYDPLLPMDEQIEQVLFWEHLTVRIPGPHFSGKHAFLGHTPQPGGKIGYFPHFTCIDTCCFGGYWLTALEVETGEIWQFSREGHLRDNWRTLRKFWRRLTGS
jgi:serine/threonine protein phosphatase 1